MDSMRDFANLDPNIPKKKKLNPIVLAGLSLGIAAFAATMIVSTNINPEEQHIVHVEEVISAEAKITHPQPITKEPYAFKANPKLSADILSEVKAFTHVDFQTHSIVNKKVRINNQDLSPGNFLIAEEIAKKLVNSGQYYTVERFMKYTGVTDREEAKKLLTDLTLAHLIVESQCEPEAFNKGSKATGMGQVKAWVFMGMIEENSLESEVFDLIKTYSDDLELTKSWRQYINQSTSYEDLDGKLSHTDLKLLMQKMLHIPEVNVIATLLYMKQSGIMTERRENREYSDYRKIYTQKDIPFILRAEGAYHGGRNIKLIELYYQKVGGVWTSMQEIRKSVSEIST